MNLKMLVKTFIKKQEKWLGCMSLPSHHSVLTKKTLLFLDLYHVSTKNGHKLKLGGGFNPSEKNISQIGSSPQVGAKITHV